VTIPAGQVISQDPSAGTLLDPGSAVSVVVSAGPQTFVVPDLVGSTMQGATDALTALGLRVVTQEASSEATPGVVLEMFPAPGASVSAGDEIRLMVPGGSGAEQETLLPYDLRGATILIDPLPAPGSATGDVPMEIARRLRSLLEAAGATVTVTRTGASEAGTPAIRTAAAESSAADLFVGIDLGASGVPGLRVYHLPPEAEEPYAADSLKHARAITRAANLPGLIVNEPLPTSDPVLGAFGRTGVRVVVGDGTVDSDRSRFTDPAWADQIARAIYRGLGTTLAAP
jgi:N-acetylmuramoyl-L-alanine amidase